jgi:hypothetical protein
MDNEHGEHGYESSGNPQSAATRPGEGGYERGEHDLPEEVGRMGEPQHPGTAGQDAADLLDLTGQPVTGAEDVMSLDADQLVDSDEPDFMDDVGTTDVMLAVEEGLTYIPPIDPVVAPDPDSEEGLDVVGGFATDSLESPLEPIQVPPRMRRNDDELAEAVARALRADSYTTDLAIDVEVEDGVVYLRGQVTSLEDIEQAEEVAGRVPGVEDVEEELEIV